MKNSVLIAKVLLPYPQQFEGVPLCIIEQKTYLYDQKKDAWVYKSVRDINKIITDSSF